MTHLADTNLLLSSKQKFRIGLACSDLARPKQNFCLDMEGLNQRDVSPCNSSIVSTWKSWNNLRILKQLALVAISDKNCISCPTPQHKACMLSTSRRASVFAFLQNYYVSHGATARPTGPVTGRPSRPAQVRSNRRRHPHHDALCSSSCALTFNICIVSHAKPVTL